MTIPRTGDEGNAEHERTLRGVGYAHIDNAMMADVWQHLTGSEAKVLPVLLAHLPNVEPGIERIGELAGLGENTVKRAIRSMEHVGLLSRKQRRARDGRRMPNHIEIVGPDDPEAWQQAVQLLRQRSNPNQNKAREQDNGRKCAHGVADDKSDGRKCARCTSTGANAPAPEAQMRSSHRRICAPKALEGIQTEEKENTKSMHACDGFSHRNAEVGVFIDKLKTYGIKGKKLATCAKALVNAGRSINDLESLWAQVEDTAGVCPEGLLVHLIEDDAEPKEAYVRRTKGNPSRVPAKPGKYAGVAKPYDATAPSKVSMLGLEDDLHNVFRIHEHSLADTAMLLTYHRCGQQKGVVPTGMSDLVFVSLAERALRVTKAKGGNPVLLFSDLIKNRRTDFITQADEDRANERLKRHRHGAPPMRTPTPTESQRIERTPGMSNLEYLSRQKQAHQKHASGDDRDTSLKTALPRVDELQATA